MKLQLANASLRQLAREGLVTRVGAAKKWALVPIANIQSQKSTPVSPPAPVIREAEELLEDDELLAEDVDGLDDAAFEADVAPERRARPSLRQDTAKSEVAKGASWWLTAGRDHFTMAAEGQLTRMRLSKESQRGRYRAIEDE